MTPQEHFEATEALLAEGVKTVQKIAELAERRRQLSERVYADEPGSTTWHELVTAERQIESMTIRMDEYGKKAMGIWAQAQVHATLANRQYSAVNVVNEIVYQ
ncbi:hypothetical protein FHT44_004982 [Mycolicibacterium sp. BK634]|uniref:hypothetical protein n=1 Tax=Mycolicibacterium sp. BK634 TaxID=2587099 RepID=UPI0017AABA00|nr:hypothetical protein [Mycolicibacterium sp. BK634]MBB3752470.1 hypothetical protein [Mycolicibacterium sp. BK634]